MGEYTEICVAVQIKATCPESILQVLEYLVRLETECPTLPDHQFFRCTRWRAVATCGSAYFPSPPLRDFSRNNFSSITLSIRANLKNYDNEIEHFCDWLAPYVDDSNGFAGFSRPANADHPTLIYFSDGKVKFQEVPDFITDDDDQD